MEAQPTLEQDLNEISDRTNQEIQEALQGKVPQEVIDNIKNISTNMGCRIVARILRMVNQHSQK